MKRIGIHVKDSVTKDLLILLHDTLPQGYASVTLGIKTDTKECVCACVCVRERRLSLMILCASLGQISLVNK